MTNTLMQIREKLHLSQEFVAKQLNINKVDIIAIETNKRKPTSEELEKFTKLYGDIPNLNNNINIQHFTELSNTDKQAIINLLNFKKRYLKG